MVDALSMTPSRLKSALAARWQAPSQEQQDALGHLLWEGMLEQPLGQLIPRDAFREIFLALMNRALVRTLWQLVPRETLLHDLKRLRTSEKTLSELLGPETCGILREQAALPVTPNRELVERLLDQPLLRQALRSLLTTSIKQFLGQVSQFAPQGGASSARGSIIGALGRSVAQRAEKAVQIGKTFVEGMGSSLFHQVEDQLQPFLAGYMSRAVHLLVDGLFAGEQQQNLGIEARQQILEILLTTDLKVLMSEPEAEPVERGLMGLEAFCARLTGLEPWQKALESYLLASFDALEGQTLRQIMQRHRMKVEGEPVAIRALGALGYRLLSRPPVLDFLEAELAAVWEQA